MSSKGTEKIKKNSASKAVAIRIFKNPMAIVGILLVIILCFAAVFAPILTQYSPTKVTVSDGKPAKIIKTNGMYMGVVAPKGNHKIEYSYVTPGLGLGSALSLAGWLVTISLFIIFRRKKNTN